jgi:RsiW-degrading membrane proteinase PrsW (M82 family)
MFQIFTGNAARSRAHGFVLACTVVAAFGLGERPVHAQGRDPLLNGTVLGAAVGAGMGVAFVHAVRDTEGLGQYAHGALIFGAMGAGVGLGIDALLNRAPSAPGAIQRRVLITPTVWRHLGGVVVRLRW